MERQLWAEQKLSSTHFRSLSMPFELETGRLMALELATGALGGDIWPKSSDSDLREEC